MCSKNQENDKNKVGQVRRSTNAQPALLPSESIPSQRRLSGPLPVCPPTVSRVTRVDGVDDIWALVTRVA